MTQCDGIREDMPCDQEAHGVLNTHGCTLRNLCVGCKVHLDAIIDQIFGVVGPKGVMECYVCSQPHTRSDWSSWKLYESQ